MMFFQTDLCDNSFLPIATKLVLAAVAGAIIGWEREMHGRPAGLRTHVLVSAGSCLMMVLSEGVFLKYGHLLADGIVRIDPGRIAAQVITGIGFLGAGVIIKEGMAVRGLTTAASLWMMSGIGMAFGLGMMNIGIFSTLLASGVLIILKKMDYLVKKDRFLRLSVVADSEKDLFPRLLEIFAEANLGISNVEQELNIEAQVAQYDFIVTRQRKRIGPELLKAISALEGVKKIRYK
jgi:putative Mg2+ transporter-C (MgtC) family protein